MIGKLTGRIDSLIGSTQLILDVQGVGYLVSCSAHTLRVAGEIGDTAMLWIEMHVREDAINLYGFASVQERDWFRLLTTVQGVGAKSALSILGYLSPERLAGAIASGDKGALTMADGVGPKLAARLITELKDKVSHMAAPVGAAISKSGGDAAPVAVGTPNEDALSALLNLGYRRMEAFAAVTKAASELGEQASLDALIRKALFLLAKQE